MMFIVFLLLSIVVSWVSCGDTDQTHHNAMSNLDLHFLLIGCSINI